MHYQDQYFANRHPTQSPPEYNEAGYRRVATNSTQSSITKNKKREFKYSSPPPANTMHNKGPLDLDYRATRFANAIVFLAVLVLVVDSSRIILYSYYSDGTVLKYVYGKQSKIEWTKCSTLNYPDNTSKDPGLVTTSPNLDVTTSKNYRSMEVAVATATKSAQNGNKTGTIYKITSFIYSGIYHIGGVIRYGIGNDGKENWSYPVFPKVIVQILFHGSSVACLLFLFVGSLPPIARNHSSYCLLCFGQLIGLLSVLIGGLAMVCSMVKIIFFCMAEISPEAEKAFDFIPQCSLLRKAYFCAECFSLLVLVACICMTMCLKVFFCRSCCHCCCPDNEETVARHAGYAYDDEEYLA